VFSSYAIAARRLERKCKVRSRPVARLKGDLGCTCAARTGPSVNGDIESGHGLESKDFLDSVVQDGVLERGFESKPGLRSASGSKDVLQAVIVGRQTANGNVRGFVRKWRASVGETTRVIVKIYSSDH
jgi:hypothetical protein